MYLRPTDVPKKLHAKLKAAHEDYLRNHHPVLKRNLGAAQAWEPVFQDDVHGPGASNCFTLFPGYWKQTRSNSLTENNFKLVLVLLSGLSGD